MSAFNISYVTQTFSTIVFVILPDELFVAFEIICSILTRVIYGQEGLRDPALLILLTGVYIRFLRFIILLQSLIITEKLSSTSM
jgi:hypothetical protein